MTSMMWGACALSALGVLGCTDGEDLLLGQAALAPDAAAESPPDEVTPAASPDAATAEPSASAPELRRCDVEISRELPVEVRVRDIVAPSCAAPCSLQLHQVRAVSDGSAWVSGGVGGGRERLWLGHYDAMGELLGSATVENASGAAGYLAVDDHGNAWLLTGTFASGQGNLHRFDPSAHEIEVQPVAGPNTDLIRYPGVGVLVSSGSHPRVITALNYEGEPVWSRADATRRMGRLAIDQDGQIALGSPVPAGTGADAPPGDLVIDWLGQSHSELRGTTNPFLRLDHFGFFGFVEMAFDASGQLTLAAAAPADRLTGPKVQTIVERVDLAQGSLWRWEIDAPFDPALTIDMATGTTLVAAWSADQPAYGLREIVAIAPDGKSCRRFSFDGPSVFGAIDSGPNGEIWFAGTMLGADSSIGNYLGRLARPEL